MKKIVITGATGSIGLALIKECISQQVEVLALVHPGSERISRIPPSDLVKVVECDLKNLGMFSEALKQSNCGNDSFRSLSDYSISAEETYDAFFHLGWMATSDDRKRNLLALQAQNIQYALDAVKLAADLHCNVFVGAGSQAEYGRTEEVLTESTVPHPETGYGMAKLCAGQMTRLACRQLGIRHIWTRILSTYGPESHRKSVLSYTIQELLKGNSPCLTGGEQIWDFMYVEDTAKALYALAQYGRDGETYVLGSGSSDLLRNYLVKARQAVERITGRETPALGLGEVPYGEHAVMHLACSIDKLSADTGFRPQTSFEEGIKQTIYRLMEEGTDHPLE